MGIKNDTHIYFVFGRVGQTKSTIQNESCFGYNIVVSTIS